MTQIKKENTLRTENFLSGDKDYKKCPNCGQSQFPFKLGVCICGNQVGEIQYVKNPNQFAKNYFPYEERFDTAVEETFAGIPEWDDSIMSKI
jgi:hypothetical protein